MRYVFHFTGATGKNSQRKDPDQGVMVNPGKMNYSFIVPSMMVLVMIMGYYFSRPLPMDEFVRMSV